MTNEQIEDFKKIWENPEKIYSPQKDFDAIMTIMKALDEPPKYIEENFHD